ncbi:helix-turn-helix transcriptional regulator [Deinococcus taeanensis]|uniref:helix-turn-helix transcriptional regulator n=1 Tax=Deinococcus taeanensis TaxID=2737050 RepID=UPI0032E7FE0F
MVGTDAQLLAALLRAVRHCCTVRFTYAAPDALPTTRDADMYRVVHQDGRWYAVGHCHLRGARRSFRVDRIRNLEVQARTFSPPADFDAVAYLRSTLRAPQAPHEISVWLDCPPENLRGRVSTWGTDLTGEGRGTRLTTRRESLRGFAAFLLGLDCPFQVDHPAELRGEFAHLAERCAEHSRAYTEV